MAKINKKTNTTKKSKENIETYKIYPELHAVFDTFIENEIRDLQNTFQVLC